MKIKKKLLIVNGNQFGYSAGHYYYCKYLKDEFQIDYICYDRGYEKLLMDGIGVHYVPFEGSKFQRPIQFIKNCILLSRKTRPDILFVVYFDFCFLLALFAKGKMKIADLRTGSLNINSLKKKWANRYIKLQSLLFDKITILSESLRDHLKIKTMFTLVMPLGAEIYFSGIKDFSVLNLLYVGVLNNRRIYDTVEGLAIFIDRNPASATDIKYTIIGFGTESEINMLHCTIEKYNLQNIVNFEGRKNYTELPAFFEKANIGIAYVPLDEYYQRQPVTKVFEYGLSGIYNIATETYENQLVINHVNGVLCRDNPASFAESLELVYQRRYTLNSVDIRSTFRSYEWENLIKNKLLPFLNESINRN